MKPIPQTPDCPMCGNKQVPKCTTCNFCTRCCFQEDCCRKNITRYWNTSYFNFENLQLPASTFVKNTSKRLIGCELEIADFERSIEYCEKLNSKISAINAIAINNSATISKDGSLTHTGVEIVTYPAKGDAFVEQISKLTSDLASISPEIDSTCGYHVHIDCADFTKEDLVNFLRVYCLLEKAIFLVLPSERKSNYYCKTFEEKLNVLWETSNNVKHRITKLRLDKLIFSKNTTKADIDRQKLMTKSSSRYVAINLTRWFKHKTIEIRAASGTVDKEKIINWALFWAGFCDKIKTNLNSLYKIKNYFTEVLEIRERELKLPEEERRDYIYAWKALMLMAGSDTIRAWLKTRLCKFNRDTHNQLYQRN